jgi:type I restriction enzyme S subunit
VNAAFPVRCLSEIATSIDYGVTASASAVESGPKFLRITDIQGGVVDWRTVPFCEAPPKKLRSAQLSDGDIVFARTGATTGKSFLIQSPPDAAVFASYLIRVKPSTAVIPSYLAHFFQSKNYWSQIRRKTQGAAQGGVNATSLSGIEIPLPPLAEQRRIAAILDKPDALRRKRRRALELLDSLTQSIFLGMFGDLVESCAYPRGTVSNWVADFDTGKNLAPDPDAKQIDGYRVLKVSAVTKGVFLPQESKPLPVGYEPPASHIVNEGDLLFSRANTAELIGATAYVETAHQKLVLPDKIWRFVWRETNSPNPRFVHALFSTPSFRRALTKRATGTSGSMKNISKPKVLGIEIALPTREQQDAFAARYRVIRQSLSTATMQSTMLEDQFSSLQSRAFSGQL